MKSWIVRYNLEVAPKTFYPLEVTVRAHTEQLARIRARKVIAGNTNMEKAEKVIISEIIPL